MRRRMMASIGGVKPWKNPYISDGLVAMWDGEWNAGGGVHDPNATVWKPIVGDIVFDVKKCTWKNEGALHIPKGVVVPTVNESVFKNYQVVDKPFTIQFIFSVDRFVIENFYLTFDEFYVYWQKESEIIGSFNHRGSPNKTWNFFHLSLNEKFNYGLNTFISTGSSNKMSYIRNEETRAHIGDKAEENKSPRKQTALNRAGGSSVSYKTIRVYDRVLTSDEIAANYAIDKERFGLP